MTLLKELRDQIRAAHLLVRSSEDWNRLSKKVDQAWSSGAEDRIDTARKLHLISWASVARNLLADHFEGVGITTTPASSDWGVATLSTGRRSCQPLLIHEGAPAAAGAPRLRNFEEVMTAYDACLDHLAGTGSGVSPAENERHRRP